MMSFSESLDKISHDDVAGLIKAQDSYGDSWKKRGGTGAFMMLARKWDRLELQAGAYRYDIFQAAEKDERAEGVIDDIRDLRRYLMLVEAELLKENYACARKSHRDNATPPIPPAF